MSRSRQMGELCYDRFRDTCCSVAGDKLTRSSTLELDFSSRVRTLDTRTSKMPVLGKLEAYSRTT